MFYVLAGVNKREFPLLEKYNMNHILLSQLDNSWLKNILPLLTKKHHLIVDSWAFTAWTLWKVLDIDEYWKKCVKIWKEFGHRTNIYFVSLDVIPSKPWRRPTKSDIEESAQKSLNNYLYLEKHYKVKWMPVFHQHEDFKRLQKYIDHWVDYLWISPANDLRPKERLKWLQYTYHKYLIKTKVKTHWFWVSTILLVKNIPFYTYDSMSWKSWSIYNIFAKYKNYNFYSYSAKKYREKFWIDLSKLSNQEKIELNLREYAKMSKSMYSLHKARKTLYRLQ